jgi:hypothetical protein
LGLFQKKGDGTLPEEDQVKMVVEKEITCKNWLRPVQNQKRNCRRKGLEFFQKKNFSRLQNG